MAQDQILRTKHLKGNNRGIAEATKLLASSELVSFPTETVYGLGADARSDSAVAKIFSVKKRPTFNPLIVHVASKEQVEYLARIPHKAIPLIEKFWPGPLTLVLQKRKYNTILSDLVTAKLDTIAVRVPSHCIALNLLKKFEGPIAAPSANISGNLTPTRASDVFSAMEGKISAILDGGSCPVGLESTIIKFSNSEPVLLRPGGIPIELIQETLGRQIKNLTGERILESQILSPGQLLSHYAPKSTLRLNVREPLISELYLGFGKMPRDCKGICLSNSSNLEEAAEKLFSSLHDLDKMAATLGINKIAVAPIPNRGLGLALNDRLKKASIPKIKQNQ